MLTTILGKLLTRALGLPREVWFALAAIALVVAGYLYHEHRVRQALDAAYARGEEAANASWVKAVEDLREAADKWREKAESTQAQLSKQIGERNEEESRRIASDTDALRVRGPGKAEACAGPVGGTSTSAPSGEPGSTAGRTDGATAPMPSEDRGAAVPWSWLVDRAEQCDLYRAEVDSWRRWYDEQTKLNKELRHQRLLER